MNIILGRLEHGVAGEIWDKDGTGFVIEPRGSAYHPPEHHKRMEHMAKIICWILWVFVTDL